VGTVKVEKVESAQQQSEYKPYLSEFGRWAGAKARLLATGGRYPSGIKREGYLQDGAYATAAIAKLNRLVGTVYNASLDTLEWTFEGLPGAADSVPPDASPNDGGPSSEELAAHAALTLYAAHQHSVHEASMTTDQNVSFGRAVGLLSVGNPNEAGVRRDFDKVQTASSWKELLRHARRLIQMFRRARIPLNYGLFAQDILQLRAGGNGANMVRRRWGRDELSAYSKGLEDLKNTPQD
jgi:CRISPR system Cascade subunit CasB